MYSGKKIIFANVKNIKNKYFYYKSNKLYSLLVLSTLIIRVE